MTTLATRPRAGKAGRTYRLLKADSGMHTLCISQSGKEDIYWLAEFKGDWGRCFQLTKWSDATEYNVNIDPSEIGSTRPGFSLCDCRGHLAYGSKTVCKHIAVCRHILAGGAL